MRPWRDAVAAALGVWLVSLAGLALTYSQARDAQIDGVRSELMQLAAVVASQVDGDLHRTLEAPGLDGSEAHQRALAPLANAHRALADVIYIYTAILRDGRILFVLDSTAAYHRPGALPPDPILTPYPGTDAEFRQALETRTATANTSPQVEPLGTYMSGFAPFYDQQGRFVGVVGVDLRLDAFEARLAGIRRPVLASAAASTVMALLAGALVGVLRRGAAAAQTRDREAVTALARARDEAERQAHEAQRANAVKDTFLGVMSHELRTPLNAVIGYSELLAQDFDDGSNPDHARGLEHIRAAGRNLLALVTDILEYTRLESGRVDIAASPVDPKALLAALRDATTADAAAKGLTLTVRASHDLRPFLGDGLHLRQALDTLVHNAVKFTDRGSITLSARLDRGAGADTFTVAVTDTGVGIPADKLAAIFQPFAQADGSTTRRFGGTGLGLAIASRLAAAMRGTLTVASEVGTGTTFTLAVPAPPLPDPPAGPAAGRRGSGPA